MTDAEASVIARGAVGSFFVGAAFLIAGGLVMDIGWRSLGVAFFILGLMCLWSTIVLVRRLLTDA